MATPYAVSTSIGSQTFQGYVNAPIQGPLTAQQYPCAMPYHSYGTLTGVRPTPPQFVQPLYSDMSVNARQQYLRATSLSARRKMEQNAEGKLSAPITKIVYPSGRHVPVSSHMNYIAPIPSSMLTTARKSVAVGKSAYKVGLPDAAPISTKSYDTSFRRTALRRARSGGSVAPRKKGSVFNHSLTQPGICAWGAIPRQNY